MSRPTLQTHRDGWIDKQSDRQTDIQTDRQTDRQIEGGRETERERETDRYTGTIKRDVSEGVVVNGRGSLGGPQLRLAENLPEQQSSVVVACHKVIDLRGKRTWSYRHFGLH